MPKINKQELHNTFGLLVKLFITYILLIEIFRTIFIVYYYDKLSSVDLSFFDALYSYVHGFSLDIAIACYFLIIPWLLVFLNSLLKINFIKILIHLYTLLLISISSFIYIAELGVYNEWEEKPTYGILTYLKHPTEPLETNPIEYTIIFTILLIFVLTLMYKISKKIFADYNAKSNRNLYSILALLIIAPILIFSGLRGGYSSAPIKQADAYFSKYKILNDISLNTVYNFFASITQNYSIINGENIYKTTYPQKEKTNVLKKLMPEHNSTSYTKVLTTTRPNIVIIIMESLSGDFINTQKYRDLIPNIMKLSNDGIFFTKAYASGTLSHEGVPSIYSGFPAIQDVFVTNLPQKFNKLPSINESLIKYNYDSMFLYGGQLRYGNLASYIYKNKFNIIEEGKDITDVKARGRMGVADGEMFKYFIKKTSKLKEPFFSTMFTLSSHSPYDQPMQDVVKWNSSEDPYLNSVVYLDKSIGEFIKNAKRQQWYKNTLFIFVSDHSHSTPYGWSRNDPRWHKIVMFMYGDVIKKEYKGYKFDKIVGQHDIAATLLSQMNIDHKSYLWSRNIFSNNYTPSCYYTIGGGGYGLITPKGSSSYGLKQKRILYSDGNSSSLNKKGAIYIENLLGTYLKL